MNKPNNLIDCKNSLFSTKTLKLTTLKNNLSVDSFYDANHSTYNYTEKRDVDLDNSQIFVQKSDDNFSKRNKFISSKNLSYSTNKIMDYNDINTKPINFPDGKKYIFSGKKTFERSTTIKTHKSKRSQPNEEDDLDDSNLKTRENEKKNALMTKNQIEEEVIKNNKKFKIFKKCETTKDLHNFNFDYMRNNLTQAQIEHFLYNKPIKNPNNKKKGKNQNISNPTEEFIENFRKKKQFKKPEVENIENFSSSSSSLSGFNSFYEEKIYQIENQIKYNNKILNTIRESGTKSQTTMNIAKIDLFNKFKEDSGTLRKDYKENKEKKFEKKYNVENVIQEKSIKYRSSSKTPSDGIQSEKDTEDSRSIEEKEDEGDKIKNDILKFIHQEKKGVEGIKTKNNNYFLTNLPIKNQSKTINQSGENKGEFILNKEFLTLKENLKSNKKVNFINLDNINNNISNENIKNKLTIQTSKNNNTLNKSKIKNFTISKMEENSSNKLKSPRLSESEGNSSYFDNNNKILKFSSPKKLGIFESKNVLSPLNRDMNLVNNNQIGINSLQKKIKIENISNRINKGENQLDNEMKNLKNNFKSNIESNSIFKMITNKNLGKNSMVFNGGNSEENCENNGNRVKNFIKNKLKEPTFNLAMKFKANFPQKTFPSALKNNLINTKNFTDEHKSRNKKNKSVKSEDFNNLNSDRSDIYFDSIKNFSVNSNQIKKNNLRDEKNFNLYYETLGLQNNFNERKNLTERSASSSINHEFKDVKNSLMQTFSNISKNLELCQKSYSKKIKKEENLILKKDKNDMILRNPEILNLGIQKKKSYIFPEVLKNGESKTTKKLNYKKIKFTEVCDTIGQLNDECAFKNTGFIQEKMKNHLEKNIKFDMNKVFKNDVKMDKINESEEMMKKLSYNTAKSKLEFMQKFNIIKKSGNNIY